MARFALITVAGGGNLPPLMRLAAELTARGHDVEILGGSDVEPAARAAALPFIALPEQAFWTWTAPRSVLTSLGQAVRLQSDRRMERHVAAELNRLHPDVVLVDCLLSGCGRAAGEAGFRTAVLFHSYLEYWTKNLATGPVGLLAGLRGRSPARSWNAADLRIVMCDELLDPSAHPVGVLWTGSTERGIPARPEEPPLVVASLSTSELPGQVQAYRNIVSALGALPVRAVVTISGRRPHNLAIPPNVDVQGSVPHDELFSRASVVIGHAGHSTTFRALAHGLPLLLMPMHRLLDQPMVARSVADAGAAIVLTRAASATEIEAALRTLLGDPAFAAATARIGERLRSVDGTAAAADTVLALAQDPVRP